jgi:hypothetical protein
MTLRYGQATASARRYQALFAAGSAASVGTDLSGFDAVCGYEISPWAVRAEKFQSTIMGRDSRYPGRNSFIGNGIEIPGTSVYGPVALVLRCEKPPAIEKTTCFRIPGAAYIWIITRHIPHI